jgi:Zn-dependent M28 family amino/carboxypeptidase
MPAKGTDFYTQPMILNIKGFKVQTENVAAIIKGTEFPEEYIVISSHLDHIGIENGEINNGADDDGSGTVALLEIAQAFKMAQINGNGPKRTLIFLHVTGEEKGLLGSKYYTENPLYPLNKTMVNLNVDMIGRTDPKRIDKDPNYIYLIGADRLSQDLHDISEAANNKYTKFKIDYTFNDKKDPNRFYYRSDHYNFAKNNIPVIFYFSGTHEDYHKPGDTVDKIIYELLAKRTKLIFYTAWELANRSRRINLNK